MIQKLRPNVLFLALMVTGVTVYLAVRLIAQSETMLGNEILALLIGVGIGGLVGVMSAVAQDPPPPTVPADTAERMFNKALDVGFVTENDDKEVA